MNNPHEIMAAYFEGKLDADQVAELEAWLREDPDRTRTLLRQAMLECHLGELLHEKNVYDFTSTLPDDSHFGAVLAALDAPEQGVEPVDITAAVLQREQQRREAIEREEQARLAREREAQAAKGPRVIIIPKPIAWLALAAAIALVAFVGYEVFNYNNATSESIAELPIPTVEPSVFGHVSTSYNAAWVGAAPDTGLLYPDQRLELADGIVELTFNDGGVVLVQAPAIFQATGPNAMRLLSGRLTAKIPKSAHGFAVDTPHLNIIDLGTEFGVEVDPLRSSQADVFTGKVVATGLADQGENQPVELTAGLAAAADVQGQLGEVQPARETRYYRNLSNYIAAPKVSGEGVYLSSPPKDVSINALESSDHIFVFLEQAGVKSYDLKPAERIGLESSPVHGVDVFMVHFDPETTTNNSRLAIRTKHVVLTFDRPIVGVITDEQRLYQTDAELGSPQTHYPPFLSQPDGAEPRGADLYDGRNADTYVLSADRKEITITLHASGYSDQMRIITQAAMTD